MNVMSSIDAKELPATDTVDELWYKDAIIYQLHVKAFADSNNDGIGDFAGLTEKLGYLQELGVTALWLLPFYPSPGRDDGYDIADYGDINPDFGTMKDFRRFIVEAKRRGLRVITELVVNHTSDQHDWFKRARRSDPKSSARNWYVWSDTDQKYQGTRIIFTDTEKSNWTWDPEAGQFYWHRFFSHQPDLNFDNPRVVSAILQVMKRWLDAGVDGFRLDAIPYLCERDGTNNENLPETHAIIKKLRGELDAYSKGKVLLAEANQWPEDVQEYFGRGDECQMAYHFPLMPRIYMAIAQEDRFPITDILRQTPDIPNNCQWALFLRNHDELTLEMVTDVERDYLWSTYANDPRARINVGIRRRLAPLMDNDRRKIELMNSLLLSFPGTPIIYYGDEIGMGDNIYLGDRNGVRTPMQWTPDRNGGFSRADPARLYAPTIMDPVYGYESVNVEAQSRSLSSLLSATKRLISVRKSTLAFGRGTMTFIRPLNRSVLAYVRQYGDEVILCVANLSRSAQATELDLSAWKDRIPLEMLGRTPFPGDRRTALHDHAGALRLLLVPAPGARQIRARRADGRARIRNAGGAAGLDLGVAGAHPRRVRTRRAAGASGADALVSGALAEGDPADADLGDPVLRHRRQPALARLFRDHPARHHDALCAADADRMGALRSRTLQSPRAWPRCGRARAKARCWTSRPTRSSSRCCCAICAKSLIVEEGGLRLEFTPTSKFSDRPIRQPERIRAVETEQSNSTALVDNDYVVKVYRKLEAGINPEIEMGRFLTEVAGFANTPALLGSVELVEGNQTSAIAIVHAFVENQGDGWTVTSAYLDRFVEEQRLLASERTSRRKRGADPLSALHVANRQARRRDASRARQQPTTFADFAPEPITARRRRSAGSTRSMARAERVFDTLTAAARLVQGSRSPADRPIAGAATDACAIG